MEDDFFLYDYYNVVTVLLCFSTVSLSVPTTAQRSSETVFVTWWSFCWGDSEDRGPGFTEPSFYWILYILALLN